ncbi:MAG: hypothetical protein JNN20_07020 [Betaproteobacteria bacterium]|nr:hypothetical protein [Betaproteobacteria bacterium]
MPNVTENEVLVKFAEHIPGDRIAGMVNGMAAYGNVDVDPDGLSFTVRVFRYSKLPRLKEQLLQWEKYGFLRWKPHG